MGKGSATTVVVAEIQQRQLRTYYVGDSLVLLTGQRGRLKFQNTSHSPVGYAWSPGLLMKRRLSITTSEIWYPTLLALPR